MHAYKHWLMAAELLIWSLKTIRLQPGTRVALSWQWRQLRTGSILLAPEYESVAMTETRRNAKFILEMKELCWQGREDVEQTSFRKGPTLWR